MVVKHPSRNRNYQKPSVIADAIKVVGEEESLLMVGENRDWV